MEDFADILLAWFCLTLQIMNDISACAFFVNAYGLAIRLRKSLEAPAAPVAQEIDLSPLVAEKK